MASTRTPASPAGSSGVSPSAEPAIALPTGSDRLRRLNGRLGPRAGGPVVALLALVVGFTLLDRQFLTVDNGFNILREGAILAVIALAGTLVVLMGSVDLSVAAATAFTGVCAAYLTVTYGLEWTLLIPLLGAACGLVNGLLVAYARLPSFIITLGMLFVFSGLGEYVADGAPITLQDNALSGVLGGNFLGTRLPNNVVWAAGAVLVLSLVALRTRFGRHVYGVGGGESVMVLSGVDVRRTKLAAFVIGGVLASLAGLLLTYRIGSAQPTMGDTYLLPSIAAIVIGGTPLTGGVGGPQRTVLGVLILAVLANGMTVAGVGPFLQTVVQGVVVILAVVVSFDRSKVALVK